jgi:hypothetical protein
MAAERHARHRGGPEDLEEFTFAEAHNQCSLMFGAKESPAGPGWG